MQTLQYGEFEIEVGTPTYQRLVKQGILPAAAEATETDEDLSSLNREQLDELAAKVGVEEPEKLKSKADIIAAIQAADELS